MTQLFRPLKQFFQLPLKCSAVIKPCQGIVIPLMFNPKPFYCHSGDILCQANLHLLLNVDLQADIPEMVSLSKNLIDFHAVRPINAGAFFVKLFQQFPELCSCHGHLWIPFQTQHGKKVF